MESAARGDATQCPADVPSSRYQRQTRMLGDETSNCRTRNAACVRGEIAPRKTVALGILLDVEDVRALRDEIVEALLQPRRPGLLAIAEGETRCVLPRRRVVHGVALEQHGNTGAVPRQRREQPKYRIVLLFESGAICRFDDC